MISVLCWNGQSLESVDLGWIDKAESNTVG
jgi:hypothetical protein